LVHFCPTMPAANGDSNGHHVSEAPVDLSHHLSTLSKSRQASPLKDIVRYMSEPGMISLAGGLPSASLFPFSSLKVEAFRSDTYVNPEDLSPPVLETLSLARNGKATDNTLSKAMQYTAGTGDVELTKFCYDFVKTVFKPARNDFQVLLNAGNTDAWAKVVQLLCEPGEYILVEEFVYPSAQHFYIPLGCKGVPIAMDGDGLIPEKMEDILDSWEQTYPGQRKPHVLYTVPVGQNPCGTTLTWERKKTIYAIAVKHDLIIVEDDPYYWLQMPSYQLPSRRDLNEQSASATELVPPFIQLDTEGRVIRLDTFSKTISPGSRLGHFTASPVFIERLLRATEVTTQAPSGWSQAITLELLKTWTQEGYLTWLRNLKETYTTRRNWMCDAIAQQFELQTADPPEDGLTALVTMDNGNKIPVFSFVPPVAGMFVWQKYHLGRNEGYLSKKSGNMGEREAIAEWSVEFWKKLIENKVLLTPGSYYEPWQGEGVHRPGQPDSTYMRLAFSYEGQEDIEKGVQRMAEVVKQLWNAAH